MAGVFNHSEPGTNASSIFTERAVVVMSPSTKLYLGITRPAGASTTTFALVPKPPL